MTRVVDEIPGWFDFADIYRDAVAEAQPGDVLIEVGSWFGKSSAFLGLEILKRETPWRSCRIASVPAVRALCIDTWQGPTSGTHETLTPIVEAYGGDILPHWQANVDAAGVGDILQPWRKDSLTAARILERNPDRFGFVFLDDDHTLDHVRREVRAWWPLIREGGVLAGHDYDRKDSVRRAVIERFGSRVEECKPRSWRVRKASTRKPIPGLCVAINYGADRWTLERAIDSATQVAEGLVLINTAGDAPRWCEPLRPAIPARWHAAPWQDYASNQDLLLEKARQAGYTWALILDADEEIVDGHTLPELDPKVAAYRVCRLYAQDWEVWTPRLFNLTFDHKWIGARHAQPMSSGPVKRLPAPFDVLHWGDDAASHDRAKQAERFARDASAFYRDWRRSGSARALYYAAQSALDAANMGAGELPDGRCDVRRWASERFIERFQCAGGLQEERYISAMAVARIRWLEAMRGNTPDLYWAKAWYEIAVAFRPERFEARCELARLLRSEGEFAAAIEVLSPCLTMGPSGDSFLVRRSDERETWGVEWQKAQAKETRA